MIGGRALSLTLVGAGAVLFSVGSGAVAAVLGGLILGLGVAALLLGLWLVLSGLFLVSTSADGSAGPEQPIHGIIP